VDTLNPASAGEGEMIRLMARKNYSEEFRRQAVDLYESTPGATLRGIAADLGISRGTLADWVHTLGTGATTATTATSPPTGSPGSGRAEPAAAKVARLEARVAELEANQRKLAVERDILRQAAKYFAGETNW
jgi:transposase